MFTVFYEKISKNALGVFAAILLAIISLFKLGFGKKMNNITAVGYTARV